MAEHPDPVDVHVGVAMRSMRRAAGLTQESLAEAMGVRFQQLQKYETAQNRVSASRLYFASIALGASVSDFFRGLQDDPGDSDIAAILADAQALETARSIHAMPEQARKGILSIIATMTAHAA